MSDKYLCLRNPHAFTAWGPWRALQPSIPCVAPSNAVPIYEPVRAHRERVCVRCGYSQIEDYPHNAVAAHDPSGIERHRKV